MVAEDLHAGLSVGIVGWLETKLGDTYMYTYTFPAYVWMGHLIKVKVFNFLAFRHSNKQTQNSTQYTLY